MAETNVKSSRSYARGGSKRNADLLHDRVDTRSRSTPIRKTPKGGAAGHGLF
jgi:hypothetical protein